MVKKADLPKHILDRALELAAERGWRAISLSDIAAAAKVPLSQLYAIYPTKTAILDAFERELDAQVLVAAEKEAPEGSARDRLFDVLMLRFDALEPYRKAVKAILIGARRDPLLVLASLGQFMRSMAIMLEAAGISSAGVPGAIRAQGLAAIYLATLRVWLEDESEDKAKTMAALDSRLRRAESWAWVLDRGLPQRGRRHRRAA